MSKKMATVVRPPVRAFFDMFGEPYNMLHAVRKLEQKTSVLIDNKEGLHDTLSADSLTAGASVSGSAGTRRLAGTLSVRSCPVLNSSDRVMRSCQVE